MSRWIICESRCREDFVCGTDQGLPLWTADRARAIGFATVDAAQRFIDASLRGASCDLALMRDGPDESNARPRSPEHRGPRRS
jgi:hypothetical protein